MNYITLKKNIPSLLESTTCFQVSFRRDLPQIGKARFFLSLLKWHTEFGHLNRGDMLTSEQ
ncbi:hypothetical protein, partial [Shigella dysenteriae]